MFALIRKWAEFVKFSHTVFALPFAIASMALAARDHSGWPGWPTFGLILMAMVGARTCAMAFNRIADRKFDGENPRTADRHLPAGKISLVSAWTLCILSALVLVWAAHMLNPLCFYLSPVALFFVCFYSLTKRFTDFTHVWLGLALALAPIGAWIAVRGNVDFMPIRDGFALPVMLAIIVLFWLIGFDIIYAIQDYEFDRKRGLHSLVVRWGPQNALRAATLAHVIMMLLLAGFGLLADFRIAYFIGFLLIIVSITFEHWLARRRSLNWVNNAFFRLNAVVSLVFMTCTVAEVAFVGFRFDR